MRRTLDRVNLFAEEMLLHYSAPNKGLIVEILQFDAAGLADLPQQQLAQYILVLGQYLVMLQYNENMKTVEHMLTAKAYEHELSKKKFLLDDDVQGRTQKERDAWLLLSNPELQALREQTLALEAEKILMSGMVKATEGLLNALKKEISGRYAD